MPTLLTGLTARRALLRRTILVGRAVKLDRSLVDDGGGTEVEVFAEAPPDFACDLVPQERRPDDTVVGGAEENQPDMLFAYDTSVQLVKEDRIRIRGVDGKSDTDYSVRHVYDNAAGQMTKTAYVTEID